MNIYNINNFILFFSIMFLYSYSLEAIFFYGKDLTIPIFIIVSLLILLKIIKNQKVIRFNIYDILITIILLYTLIHILFYTSPLNGIDFIASSLIPYFFGRYIYLDERRTELFRKVVMIFGWLLIITLLINFVLSTTHYRVTINDTHPVALGELIGIFILVNILNFNRIDLNKINIISVLLGFAVLIIILGARGAFLSSIISLVLIYLIFSKNKLISLVLIIAIIIGFIFLLNIASNYTDYFPSLNRFSIETLLSDPSIHGNNQYLGRKDLYLLSIEEFINSPLVGSGLGVVYSHNILLELLSSFGMIGFAIFLFIFILYLVNIFILNGQINLLIIGLLMQSFIYRQTSFAFDAHKSLFLFFGMAITYLYSNKKVVEHNE